MRRRLARGVIDGSRRLLRLLVLVVALQSTGTLHAVLEISGLDGASCGGDCENDRDGDSDHCPPACPTCTCAHSARPVLLSAVALVATPGSHLRVLARSSDGTPADSPDLDGPFHPPRP
jgi:hypothetical protein